MKQENLRDKMKLRELRHNLWNIGFIEEGLEDTLKNKNPRIHWAKKRFNDRWFADPFLLKVTDIEIVVLAEEYCYNVRRGRLARVVFDRKSYEEKDYEIILDLPTHLSFPFIIRQNGKLYVMPENSASGCSTVYEYDDANRKMKPLHYVAEKPFTDATIFELDGNTYLCTTMLPEQNKDKLDIYDFDIENLKIGNKTASVEFQKMVARNAGQFFEVNNVIYRPAQDCTTCYGHGVILQNVDYKEGKWSFYDVNSIYPNSFLLNQGIHTFNHYKGLIVVDGRGYRKPIIGRILTILFKLIGIR